MQTLTCRRNRRFTSARRWICRFIFKRDVCLEGAFFYSFSCCLRPNWSRFSKHVAQPPVSFRIAFHFSFTLYIFHLSCSPKVFIFLLYMYYHFNCCLPNILFIVLSLASPLTVSFCYALVLFPVSFFQCRQS